MGSGSKQVRERVVQGALAGWASGLLVGLMDSVLVLRGTGAFWMDLGRLLEPVDAAQGEVQEAA